MSGHVLRYFPEYAAAKRLVDAGGVGTPAAIRTARMAGLPDLGGRPNWYADPAQSGGVVLDMILHDFDWLRWTFGPVSRVFAKGLYGRPEYVGRTGLRARDSALRVGRRRPCHRVVGAPRRLPHDAGDRRRRRPDRARLGPQRAADRVSCALQAAAGAGSPCRKARWPPAEDPYYQEIAALSSQALAERQPPPVTVYDAREATRIALAALESIETGKAVTL